MTSAVAFLKIKAQMFLQCNKEKASSSIWNSYADSRPGPELS